MVDRVAPAHRVPMDSLDLQVPLVFPDRLDDLAVQDSLVALARLARLVLVASLARPGDLAQMASLGQSAQLDGLEVPAFPERLVSQDRLEIQARMAFLVGQAVLAPLERGVSMAALDSLEVPDAVESQVCNRPAVNGD